MTIWDEAAFDRALLRSAVESGNARYDPEVELPASEAHAVYHSNIRSGRVHSTREAFTYAGALLDDGSEEHRERAYRVLRRVLGVQDTDPQSHTYGIWSWFWEEPLAKMSPPDWNWADFCGQAIFLILQRHADRLPSDLRRDLEAALGHAARSIERRNMGPHYTNIAFLGTFVTLAAAEYLGWEDLHAYARARLDRVAEWTDRLGTFSEFNSPTYTTVTITVLEQMRRYWQDEDARRVVARLHRRAWQHLADHWHAPTRQWAGPHSRCYSTDLRANSSAQVMLQKGTRGRLAFYPPEGQVPGNWEASRTPYACPPELLPRLLELPEARQHRECYSPADANGAIAVEGTTYLHPRFALGSCSRLDLWNQRRPLLLYWGDGGGGRSLRLQCLHDGFDFSSAQFFSAQERGCVLAGVNFACNGGDTHIHLDSIRDGVFRASDLRLRVEIVGAPEGCEAGKELRVGEPLSLDLGGLPITLCIPAAHFGEEPVRCEVSRKEGMLALDVLFYSGPEKQIRWADVANAFAGVAIQVGGEDAAIPRVTEEDGTVSLDWQSPAGALGVRMSAAVRTVGEQQASGRVSRGA